MLSSLRTVKYLALTAALVATTPFDAWAGTTDVYVTNSSNGDILKVDFDDPGTPTQLVNADNRSDLNGLFVRDDGLDGVHLVICETQTGKIWFYDTEPLGQVTGELITEGFIALPDGVSAAAGGDLFVINSGSGNAPDKNRELWTIRRDCPSCPGDYNSVPELIDGDVPADLLEATLVLTFTPDTGPLQAGDVLVLSRQPAKVWRYPGGAAPRDAAPFIDEGDDDLPAGSEPTGFSFSSNGDLLISTLGGNILRFDPSGARLSPDFANDLGNGKFKITVGSQDGEARAFVTNRNGGEVLRLRVEEDGTGTLLDTVTSGLQFPIGVGIASASASPTLPGTGVQVQPASSSEIRFEEVTVSGLTNSRIILFADPGPGRDRDLSEVPGLLETTGLPDRTIPSFVNAFDLDGQPTFLMHVLDTTAQFEVTFQHLVREQVLGFDTSCVDLTDPFDPINPSPTQQRLFHATDADDDPVVEGDSFFDISTGCSSSLGRGWDASGFLTGWDSRTPLEIAGAKLDALSQALSDDDPGQGGLSGFIARRTLRRLTNAIAAARRSFDRGDYDSAMSRLDDLIATVLNNPQSIDDSSRNVSGELVARAESANYMICGATTPDCNRLLP